jgi:hypothetical protein
VFSSYECVYTNGRKASNDFDEHRILGALGKNSYDESSNRRLSLQSPVECPARHTKRLCYCVVVFPSLYQLAGVVGLLLSYTPNG